jgi:hypothetical protein
MTITADEKEKKDKHLQNCLEMRKVCTPTVYCVCGWHCGSREARNGEKRLATHLAGKWNSECSQMLVYGVLCEGWDGYRGGVVRANNSLLIRGSRDQQRPALIPDGAALGDWRTWPDR